ncbi:MAG: ArnT family glycosyltransferase [Thermoanaerobaculia bacterium]
MEAASVLVVRSLAALVPLVALIVAALSFRRRSWSWPSAALAGSVLWGILLVAITEIWSSVTALRAVPLTLSWIACLVALGAIALDRRWRAAATADHPATTTGRFSPADSTLALVVGGVLVITLVTALVAAPNNWDSMVYHLPRVRHWMLHQSVAHFPTHNLHELYFPPLAEWIGLHLQILAGGDRLANLVQWLAFAGVATGVYEIAAELGAGPRGRLLSAVFAATIPMAVLQASSTQNDLVATLWAVVFVLFCLRSRRRDGRADLLLAGGAFGLLLLTKHTAAVIVLPFVLWWAVPRPVGGPRRRALAAALTIAVLLNTGHWVRNTRLFGNPLAPASEAGVPRYVNPDPDPATVVSNLLRNGAAHVAGPWTVWNRRVEALIGGLHERLRLERREPIATFDDHPFQLSERWLHESSAGAPFHLLVLGLATAGWLLDPELRRRGRLAAYGACLVAGFVLFAVVFRWQSGNVRLLLPGLVLWTPWAARVMVAGLLRRLALPAAMLLTATAVPPLLANEIRPLVTADNIFVTPRARQLFAGRPWEEPVLQPLLTRIREAGCDRVALITTDASYEYPVWVLLEGISPRGPRIHHVRVWNKSRSLRSRQPEFGPCAALHLFGGVREPELYWPRARRRPP